MPRITISYRREDSGVITGRIFDRLVARYGREAIFRDIDDVPCGVDFRAHIARWVTGRLTSRSSRNASSWRGRGSRS